MALFRHHHESANQPGEGAGYDAQTDLALPTDEPPDDTVFAPYAGSVTADEPEPVGYDIERDIAD